MILRSVKFVKKNVLSRFGSPRAIISSEGSNFCNRVFANLISRYEICHKKSLAYHSECNEQAEVSNRELKGILQKIVSGNQRDWSMKLDDALWAY